MNKIKQIAFAVLTFAWTTFGQVTPPKGSSSANQPTGGGPQPAGAVVAVDEYQLPIGSNLNVHTSKVHLEVDGYGKILIEDFDFTPDMGPIETVMKDRLKGLVLRFQPLKGRELLPHSVAAFANPGPYISDELQPEITKGGTWRIKASQIDALKFQYGVRAYWKLQGVTSVAMDLYLGGENVKHYSTKEGVGGETPCAVGSAQSVLQMGYATVDKRYGFPWNKETWWDAGEVTIEAFDGFATFDILDGHLLESSDPKPAFLDSLKKPEIPRQVWRVSPPGTDGVKVVLLGDLSGLVAEYSESFNGPWTIVAYRKFDTFPDGSQGFTHQPPAEATSGFYRLRALTEDEKNALARKARAASP